MRITIVGGGNIGTQFAVHCAAKNHEVTIYTSNPDIFNKHLTIIGDDNKVYLEGDMANITNDPEAAFRGVDYILVTHPCNLLPKIAPVIYDHTDTKTIIGIIPANGGGECAFKDFISRGNTVFGLQRVPSVARLIEKGKSVHCSGYRDELFVSSLPIASVNDCRDFIKNIFDMPCTSIPNYLNLTMTPSNPILHTTRLRTIFKDYYPGKEYDSLPLFYEEWSDESSKLLIACDTEVQDVCKALPDFQLDYVKSLKIHYESPTVRAMTKKISSIASFKGLKTPQIKLKNGKLIPDLHSRYFTADFLYGLTIIQQVSRFTNVKTPNIDQTIDWYRKIALETDEFHFSDYGINNIEDLKAFYLR